MNTETLPNGIERRSLEFAKRSNRLYKALCKGKDESARILGKQFLRAATSVGANIQEGCAAESRADFIHKYAIAQKEARESLYWILLIQDANYIAPHLIKPLCNETNEIIAIITASLKTAKKNATSKIK